jgi:hypothetical protein
VPPRRFSIVWKCHPGADSPITALFRFAGQPELLHSWTQVVLA